MSEDATGGSQEMWACDKTSRTRRKKSGDVCLKGNIFTSSIAHRVLPDALLDDVEHR